MAPLDPRVLPDARALAGCLIFFSSYVVFAPGGFPWMKIDRPGTAIIGAVLTVAFRILGVPDALASIDLATVVLLFSMMIIVANLRIGGVFDWVTEAIVARLNPRHLLPVVVLTSGLLLAFLVNDIVCLVMTPFVLQMTRRLGVKPVPCLLALALSSNVGSTATITRNPQNMLIGSLSGIPYLRFMIDLAPVALVGLGLTWALVHWLSLRGGGDRVRAAGAIAALPRRPVRAKPVVVLALVMAGFLADAPAALTAAVGTALLLIPRTVEPRHVYDEVDWGLLVFFIGLFIVGGADRVGLTMMLLGPAAAWNLHRLGVFVPATAVLCNLVSNVPAMILLRTLVSGFPDPHAGWIALAMTSTLAGNLTITGSAANIIVVEGAAAAGVRIGFREYARVGVSVTVAMLAFGAIWVWVTY